MNRALGALFSGCVALVTLQNESPLARRRQGHDLHLLQVWRCALALCMVAAIHFCSVTHLENMSPTLVNCSETVTKCRWDLSMLIYLPVLYIRLFNTPLHQAMWFRIQQHTLKYTVNTWKRYLWSPPTKDFGTENRLQRIEHNCSTQGLHNLALHFEVEAFILCQPHAAGVMF